MTFDKGSLVLIDYTAKIKDTGKVFDSTIKETAEEHTIHDPGALYGPRLVSVGEAWILKGVDEALADASVGDKLAVEVSPDKGFGERDPRKVRTMPLRKLEENADKVSVGDIVEIDGRNGIVKMIGSGRIQIDFNHRYAGKTLIYDVEIKKSLDSDNDKIVGLVRRHLDVEEDELNLKNEEGVVDITIPEDWLRAQDLHTVKYFIQIDIFKFLPHIERINFIDTYKNAGARLEAGSEGEKESGGDVQSEAAAGPQDQRQS